jgi:hypothetical protein
MATSMAFGLALTTFLVLLFVPALLSVYEDTAAWLTRTPQQDVAPAQSVLQSGLQADLQ